MAIARALVARPVVLVLDEPSAALDPQMEQTVLAAYGGAYAGNGHTVVVITHRYQLAMAADRVIVLDGSSIVEEGAPADLMMRGGAFARLFSLEHTSRVATPRPA